MEKERERGEEEKQLGELVSRVTLKVDEEGEGVDANGDGCKQK